MIPVSIASCLDQNHARYSVIPPRVAYTAQEEAAATHVPGAAWAKSVVCIANGEPILAVVPASCTVDLDRLQSTIHADAIRLATESEFTPMYRDCEPGAMPPFEPLFGQRVLVDAMLTRDPEIVFSGGSHHDAIRMPYPEFERLSHPTVAGVRMVRAPGRAVLFLQSACKMEFDDNPFVYTSGRI